MNAQEQMVHDYILSMISKNEQAIEEAIQAKNYDLVRSLDKEHDNLGEIVLKLQDTKTALIDVSINKTFHDNLYVVKVNGRTVRCRVELVDLYDAVESITTSLRFAGMNIELTPEARSIPQVTCPF